MPTRPSRVHRILGAGLSSWFAAAAPFTLVRADDRTIVTESQELIEEIEVVGSRLPRERRTSGLISILRPKDLDLTGSLSIADTLQTLPTADFLGTPPTRIQGGRGRRTLGLRGLGPTRTLILVNGRRTPTSSDGASDAVDLENFPPALIERIEVLPSGASPTYGADAIGGVVDIELRNDFDGFEISLAGGQSERADAHRGQASLVWGRNFSRGNLTLGLDLAGFDPIRITDRGFSESPILEATRADDGALELVRDLFTFPQGVASLDAIGSASGATLLRFDPDPQTGASFQEFSGVQNGRSINDSFYLLGEGYRSSAIASGHLSLSDSVRLVGELQYTRRDSKQMLGPVTLGAMGTERNPNGFSFPIFRGDGSLASRNSPFLPSDFITLAFDAAEDAGDPAKDGLPITLFRGLDELGPRSLQNETRTLRSVLALEGTVGASDRDIEWGLFLNYGRTDDEEATENDVNLTRALASVQPSLCQVTPGCELGDFFGVDSLRGTPRAIDFIRFKSRDRLRFHQLQVGVEVKTHVAQLSAGPWLLAIGAEYREEDGRVQVDPALLAGDTIDGGREPTAGRQLVREAFFETSIPVLHDARGAHQLDVGLAGRYTDYSSFGGRFTSRLGIAWKPTTNLRFHAEYSTGFRAPSISDLFLGPAASSSFVSDPCNGFPLIGDSRLRARCARILGADRSGQTESSAAASPFSDQVVRTNVGGNPNLSEETARTLNLGIAYDPAWLAGLRLELDYYSIRIRRPIQGQSAQFRLDSCVRAEIDSECDAIQRDENGAITFIDTPRTNLGSIETHGIDASMSFTGGISHVGQVQFTLAGGYVSEFTTETVAGKVRADGFTFGSTTALPKFKARLTGAVSPAAGVILRLALQHIGGSKSFGRRRAMLPFDEVRSVQYLDAALEVRVTESTTLFLAVQNVTDTRPPLVIGDSLINTSEIYDVVGRRYVAKLEHRF